ncbi:MAG TPA: hypothetical protein VMR21_00130 [Vicinamibacteria bacterium]|nr:hypothetical protein [Vicinamibacteria bacterium]
MSRRLPGLLPLAAGILLAGAASVEPLARPPLAPPFPTAEPSRWVGTPPTWESLRGRVVLLDVWTFG